MAPVSHSPDTKGEWECLECGYIEEGVKEKRPAQCPECSAPSSSLEFFSADREDSELNDLESSDEVDDSAGDADDYLYADNFDDEDSIEDEDLDEEDDR